MKSPFGPTGEFPRGKLNRHDEGALNIGITNMNGVVRIEFGKKIAWIGLPPNEALSFAAIIIKHAMTLKGLDHADE